MTFARKSRDNCQDKSFFEVYSLQCFRQFFTPRLSVGLIRRPIFGHFSEGLETSIWSNGILVIYAESIFQRQIGFGYRSHRF